MKNLLLGLLLVPVVFALPWIVPAWQRRPRGTVLIGALWTVGLVVTWFVAFGPGLLLLAALGTFQLLMTSVPLSRGA